MKKTLLRLLVIPFVLLSACQSDDSERVVQQGYAIEKGSILFNGEPITLNGVNALHTFGLEELGLMQSWQVTIVREFIGNLREQPIEGPHCKVLMVAGYIHLKRS